MQKLWPYPRPTEPNPIFEQDYQVIQQAIKFWKHLCTSLLPLSRGVDGGMECTRKNRALASSHQPQICRWYHFNGRKWRGTKECLDEGERGQWKSWLKTQHSKNKDHGIQPHCFMANRWEKMETVTDFIFFYSKITEDSDCSHEIIRCLLLGRKAMTNLDSILKSRDITLPTKVCIVKAMIFPVVMCGCKSWSIKQAECRRIDDFELWCWRRLLRVAWTARRSN